MLSTQYRLRLEAICRKIAYGEEVSITDMIWANKLAKANRSALEMVQLARRHAFNPDMPEGGMVIILLANNESSCFAER